MGLAGSMIVLGWMQHADGFEEYALVYLLSMVLATLLIVLTTIVQRLVALEPYRRLMSNREDYLMAGLTTREMLLASDLPRLLGAVMLGWTMLGAVLGFPILALVANMLGPPHDFLSVDADFIALFTPILVGYALLIPGAVLLEIALWPRVRSSLGRVGIVLLTTCLFYPTFMLLLSAIMELWRPDDESSLYISAWIADPIAATLRFMLAGWCWRRWMGRLGQS